jgi:hypothetical protein
MTRKIIFVASVMLFNAGVNAACPDIQGRWVASFDTTYSGETYAGVYVLNIKNTKINSTGYER